MSAFYWCVCVCVCVRVRVCVCVCSWAYGVLLWEVLTYGKVPYIGVPAATSFQGLTEYLQAGERLEKPPGCSAPM